MDVPAIRRCSSQNVLSVAGGILAGSYMPPLCVALVFPIGARRFAPSLISLHRLDHDPHRFRRWEVWRRRTRRLRGALAICEPSFWAPPILAFLVACQILTVRVTVMVAIVLRVTPSVTGLLVILVRMTMMFTVIAVTAVT